MSKLSAFLIRLYQRYISPMKRQPSCRFYPTCSAYALLCYQRFHFLKATALVVWRVLRCNPLNPGGIDYPPEKKPRARARKDSATKGE